MVNVLVSGSTGFIGSALVPHLAERGCRVTRLVRRDPAPSERAARWDPAAGTIDSAALEGVEGVVHLAGENVVGRWTARKKARILESRVRGTRLLSEALAGLDPPPAVMVCASGQDFYGDRGVERVSEEAGAGSGFVSEATAEWEAASQPAADAGIRVVKARLGMVLGDGGGALARMLPAFRLGLGGRFGDGRQYVSWISITDVVRVIHHALTTGALSGPVNVAAPGPVTNAEFARALGRALSRPALLPTPAFALRLALGEMAVLLLGGVRLDPSKLAASGFEFRHSDLESALRSALGREG